MLPQRYLYLGRVPISNILFDWLRTLLVRCSQALGRQVCHRKGCRYEPAGGAFLSWCAYACVRCGELDRPLDDLPPPPDGADYADDPWYIDPEQAEKDYCRARRWFAALPFPRWLP